MLVSYNWLKELVSFDLSPQELAERLTLSGAEVETVKEIAFDFSGVIAAQIKDCRPDPDHSGWVWCRVNTGNQEITCLCGAPNAAPGLIAPLALPGAVLPGGRTAAAKKIGGRLSEGILCSERELGLGEDHSGVMVLPAETRPGLLLEKVLDLEDRVLDIDVTPNRPDLMSVIGVGREIAALTGSRLKIPVSIFREEGKPAAGLTSVTVRDYNACPRYCARLIRNVRIDLSPFPIRRRLASCGLRPINNVVDATNYILLETGHPLHAFDFQKLSGEKIIVRPARGGEKILTLDQTERKLSEGTLVIADGEKPAAVAGVMGGAESEVGDETVDILLESAYFQPAAIRETSRSLALSTEASRRFERGADPNAAPRCLDRAAGLIVELAGGRIAPGIIDKKRRGFGKNTVAVSASRTEKLLGYPLPPKQIRQSLESIGLERESGEGDRQIFQIPTWRPDLSREVDLMEEVARLRGYDRIPARIPRGRLECPPQEPVQAASEKIRDILCGCGFNEVLTYSFLDPRTLTKLGAPEYYPETAAPRLANPVNKAQGRLRTTLIPGLLEVIRHNLNHHQTRIEIFEIGTVFANSSDSQLPREDIHLALAGYRKEGEGDWRGEWSLFDFHALKSIIEILLRRMGAVGPVFSPIEHPVFQPGRTASIILNKEVIGYGGAVSDPVIDNFSLTAPLYLAEVRITPLLSVGEGNDGFQPLPQYPAVGRDMALIVKDKVTYQEVEGAIAKHRPELLKECKLFDLYRGEPIPEGKKSFAFRLKYRSSHDTLCEDTVNKIHQRFLQSLISELDCSFRE